MLLVNDDVKNLLENLIDRISLLDGVSIKIEPRHHEKVQKSKQRSTTSKRKKPRIFSSSEGDTSSSSDESSFSIGYKYEY